MGNQISNQKYAHIHLHSGLGNQLFMIATAYAYSLRHQKTLYLNNKTKYFNNVLKKCNQYLSKQKISGFDKYTEVDFLYNEIPKFEHSVSMKGFFQSDRYFNDYEKEIKDLFEIDDESNTLTINEIKKWNVSYDDVLVAVHIRRGNYTGSLNSKHPTMDVQYYTECKQFLETKLEGQKIRYIYFSNDNDWVLKNFEIRHQDIVVSNYPDYIDFTLMRKCNHFIISNSSFSWWAAWLSNIDINKVVICPKKWFGPAGPDLWFTIYPKDWIQIECKKQSIESKFFMGILSCKKYEKRRQAQDLTKCPYEYRYFIGDETLTDYVEDIDNKIVYVPCKDTYEELTTKVYHMMKWIYTNRKDIRYVIKTDDDIRFNFERLKMDASYILQNQYDYAGVKVKARKSSSYHQGKVDDETLNNTVVKLPKTYFCPGGCYFVSSKSLKILVDNLLKDCTIYEDQSVGYCLSKFKIFPQHIPLKGKACFWE